MRRRPRTDTPASSASNAGLPPGAPESGGTGGARTPGTRLVGLRRFAVRVCVLYTVLTVTSSGLALARGQETDTHVHLLARLVFVLLGLGAFELVDGLRRRYADAPLWLLAVAGYLVAITAVMAGLWVFAATGGALHPDAYRDAFWNFTAVGVGVIVVVAIRDRMLARARVRDER